MTVALRLRVEAFADIAEAFSWYRQQRPGLGQEFEADLQATFTLLLQMPETGPVVHRDVRRTLMRRFPYAVYYTLSAGLLDVRAVIHLHRDPAHWRRRE